MTYKVMAILFTMLATLLLVAACGPKETAKDKEPTVQVTATEADQELTGLDSDISGLGMINDELDLGELETLDADLAEIEQLDIE